MRRYFFDIVGRQRCEYDYRGSDLPSCEKAHQLAELIALDLALEPDDPWYGWTVKVRSAEGCEFFAIPVQQSHLAAA